MRRYGSLNLKNSEEIKKRKEEFLEYLKSLAIEIDGQHFLPCVATINTYQNPSDVILESLKREKRIVPLCRRSKLDFELIKKIQEKLDKEPEKKKQWFWRQFFMNSIESKKGIKPKYFLNTSVLYKIKF